MGDNTFQPKNNSKMAELFMECEEDLESWQRKVNEVKEEEEEPVFVGQLSFENQQFQIFETQ